ncbi:MAG: hypothetical protein FJ242_07035 [Nitrospira sp.]|nr:hypothetical protein [Nitrospira sp.]
MTAKTTKDGKEIFRDSKIYMPQATNSRGDAMVYGPYQKLGFIRDTSLQPLQTKVETYEIRFPYEDIEKVPGEPKVREIKAKEMDVTVELRYQLDPVVGEIDEDSFIFYKTTTRVSIQ